MARLKPFGDLQGAQVWADFRGGVNLAEEPELMAENQISLGVNVEFSPGSGLLRTRRVLTKDRTLTIHPQTLHVLGGDSETLLATFMPETTQMLYRYSGSTAVSLGALTGGSSPVYCPWSDDQVLIASGGKLQVYDRGLDTLETIAASPDCDNIIVKEGRVAAALTGSDKITFSGIGDATNWQSEDEGTEEDPDYHTDDDSQWVEVGYKDGCKIVAMVMIGEDLVAFKSGSPDSSEGYIYKLSGDFPQWVVTEVCRTSRLRNKRSLVGIGGDVVYLDDSGVQVLSQVISQGDLRSGMFASADAGLNSVLNDTCSLWRLPGENKILVQPNDEHETLWVIDADLQAWTTWTFPGLLTTVSTGAAPALLSFDDSADIMILNDDGARDVWGSGYRTVNATVCMRPMTPVREFVVTRFLLRAGNHSVEDVTASITIGGLQHMETLEYEDMDIRIIEWCNLLLDEIDPRVDITGGNVVIRSVKVEWEEIG